MISVPMGGTTHTSLAVSSKHVCQMQRNILFANDRSFVRPFPEHKAAFQDLLVRLGISSTHNKLLIMGHTDSPGDAGYNQCLSERRAQSVEAVLKGNTDQWEIFYSSPKNKGGEGWGDPELKVMMIETGETDTSDPAVNRYRADPVARKDLFRRYFIRLLDGKTVPPIQPATTPLLGCGESQLLRGSCSKPSRDPSLSPVEGDCESNRRVEFFFFDDSGAKIACSEYPKWTATATATATCSLTPPAPTITVTIAPVETVKKNAKTDIQITLNPSPLPFGTTVTLTLSTTSGTGEARFTSTNLATTVITESGPVTVRGVTESSTVDNIRLSATQTGRSKVLAQEDFTVAADVLIYLQFEVWNLTSLIFEPLPAGVDVDIMDYDLVKNDRLDTRQTNAQGRVFFNTSGLHDPDDPEPDIFFLIHTNGRNHAGHTLPQEWSTKGWKAVDGTAGYWEDYKNTPIGNPSNPVVFRVGLDFHAAIKYHVDAGTRIGNYDPAPPQVLVKLMQEQTGLDRELLSLRTNADGEVHGVSFNAEPRHTLYLHISFEMEDVSINLKRTRITNLKFLTLDWDSNDVDANWKVFENNDRTSIRALGPDSFTCTINQRNVALYQLKVLRELGVFLFEITNHQWQGVEVRVYPWAPQQAFSWPRGQVNIPTDDQWNRGTIIHETSHQVMWQEADFNSLAFGILFILTNLTPFVETVHGCHDAPMLANEHHALVEGWAEFIESIFERTVSPPFSFTDVIEFTDKIKCTTRTTIGPLGPGGGAPINRGQSVEGAFANGLWRIFECHVVTSAFSSAPIPEKEKEQVVTDARWVLNTGVRDRFLSMIWKPLGSLKGIPLSQNKTTGEMINFIHSNNFSLWHKLQPELQAFNMAMGVPTITKISPTWGAIAGGQSVTIKGSNFIAKTIVGVKTLETHVEFGGSGATSVTVKSSSELIVISPPHGAGAVDVVVTTPADSATQSGGYFYIGEPLKINDVNPKRVSTRGGDEIVISGQGFLPGAIVHLDGTPVEDPFVFVDTPTLIRVGTPARSSSGSVSVAVENPDTQTDTWSGKLQYSAPPQISHLTPQSGPSSGGTLVHIYGSVFHPQFEVIFNQATLANATRIDSGHITFTTSGGGPGLVAGEVKNSDDGQSDGFEFNYE